MDELTDRIEILAPTYRITAQLVRRTRHAVCVRWTRDGETIDATIDTAHVYIPQPPHTTTWFAYMTDVVRTTATPVAA